MTHTPYGIEESPWKSSTQCRAKSKQSGERCKRPARESGVCYLHGGASLSGLAHPSTKTGRYSKHLPTRLLAQFGASLADPDLLSLRAEIALVDSSIADLMASHEDPQTLSSALLPLLEARRKLTDSERNRLRDMAQMLTAEQAVLLISTVYQAVAANVDDPAVLDAIGRDLAATVADRSAAG